MDKPAEILLFEFLTEQIEAAAADDVLFDVELHDTIHQSIKRTRGIRISDAIGDLAPDNAGGMKELDVQLEIICYAKVEGTDKKQRQDALLSVFTLQKEMYRLVFEDISLGSRFCDTKMAKSSRGYDVFDGNPYAVAEIYVMINASGGS